MFYQSEFNDSMLQCSLTIIETNLDIESNTALQKKYFRYLIKGDQQDNDINFEFERDKLIEGWYDFEIRINNEQNSLIYSTLWNNSSYEFATFTQVKPSDSPDIYLNEMNFDYVHINRPFIHTKNTCINLLEINIDYDVEVDDKYAYHKEITKMQCVYHIHNWLPHIKTYTIGHIDDLYRGDIPSHILSMVAKTKTHELQKHSFSALWLYRYYTGDIFIVNIEKKGDRHDMFQYYVVAHLHIVNNKCGECHNECLCNWKEHEINSFDNFLSTHSKNLNVEWYENNMSVIMFKNQPLISKINDCCFIDKQALNLDLY